MPADMPIDYIVRDLGQLEPDNPESAYTETLTARVVKFTDDAVAVQLIYSNTLGYCQVTRYRGGTVVFSRAINGDGSPPIHDSNGNEFLNREKVRWNMLIPRLKEEMPNILSDALPKDTKIK